MPKTSPLVFGVKEKGVVGYFSLVMFNFISCMLNINVQQYISPWIKMTILIPLGVSSYCSQECLWLF